MVNTLIIKLRRIAMKLCVYAICKNEIKFLDRWMDSILNEADYIAVLDTGSTDGT